MTQTFETAHIVTWTIVALSILGVITRPFKWPEAIWAVAGAVALVAFRRLSPHDAWDGVMKGLDVYLFLIGMMALAEVARQDWPRRGGMQETNHAPRT